MKTSNIADDVVTIGERYASATHSSDLTPRMDGMTDADVLLAAGIAAGGDERLLIALKLWRMRVNGDMDGLYSVVGRADGWMSGYLSRKGNRPIPKAARMALVADTMKWWLHPTCSYCNGHGFIEVPDTNRLSTVACTACHGTGQRPLARAVPHAHAKPAQWLAGELDKLAAVIHKRMSIVLGKRMDL